MYNSNKRGGAAIIAVLIMMILVAAGTAIMIVTGNGSITEAENVPTFAPASSSADDSSSDDSSKPDESAPDESKPDSSKPDNSKPEPVNYLPEVAENFQEVDYKAINMSGKYAILVDVDNNEILAGVNYEKKIYPASMTKVMTILVAAENIKDTDAKYKFTKKQLDALAAEDASMAGFAANEEVPFIDLMYGAILRSGADATIGLAELVAGSEEAFVELMNKKAEELGLETTHFVNCIGLHDKEHYSTCKDMATILSYALKNETCKKVLTAASYTTSKTAQHPDGLTITSLVLDSFYGYFVDLGLDGEKDGEIVGGKSGFTDEAGNALETIYEYNGKTYICVVTKCQGKPAAVIDNMSVYEHYLSK